MGIRWMMMWCHQRDRWRWRWRWGGDGGQTWTDSSWHCGSAKPNPKPNEDASAQLIETKKKGNIHTHTRLCSNNNNNEDMRQLTWQHKVAAATKKTANGSPRQWEAAMKGQLSRELNECDGDTITAWLRHNSKNLNTRQIAISSHILYAYI